MKTKLFYLLGFLFLALTFVSCSSDDDEPGSGGGSGSVKISSIVRGSKNKAHYTYKVSVQASGVSADEVIELGFNYGKGSSMVAGGKKSTSKGATSYTGSVSLSSGETYYFEPFLRTKSGTKTGSKKSTKV